MKVRVALVGFGHLGKWHAEKADQCPQASFVAIVEPTIEGQNRAKEAYPSLKIVPKIEDIIHEIDAVLIVAPTSFHFELCRKAIEANKHLFCEKPLAHNFNAAYELVELAKSRKNLTIQVGHSERCHQIWSDGQDLQQFLEDRQLVGMFRRVAPFKGRATDVDVVSDVMIHDLDLMNFLISERPTQVSARGLKARTEHLDYALATFLFPSGRRIDIEASRVDTREERTVKFVSKRGSYFIDLAKCRVESTTDSQIKEWSYEKRDHLLEEQKAFYASINELTRPMVSIEDGLRACELVEKVKEAIHSGKEIAI